MIDTAEQVTTECLACGSPIIQKGGRGHRKRFYCNNICRAKGDRQRKQELAEARTRSLESEVQKLQERLKHIKSVDEVYRYDTAAHPFKKWLREPAYKQNKFAQRALSDRDFPRELSRSYYQRYLIAHGYSEEDRQAFVDAWKEMLTTELIKLHQL